MEAAVVELLGGEAGDGVGLVGFVDVGSEGSWGCLVIGYRVGTIWDWTCKCSGEVGVV